MATNAKTAVADTDSDTEPAATGSSDYVLPIVNVHLSSGLVDAGFWGGLTGAVVLGVVDPPLGILLGAGVVVARHRMNQSRTGASIRSA